MACQRSHSKYGRELGFEPRSLRARYPLEMMLGRRAGGETISGLLNFAIMANSDSDHPLWGAVLGIVGCGAASLSSSHEVSGETLALVLTVKNVSMPCHTSSEGHGHLQLRTTAIDT